MSKTIRECLGWEVKTAAVPEIEEVPPVDPKIGRDERQLEMWRNWQKSGDEGVRMALLEDLTPLIKSNLSQYSTSTLPHEALSLKAHVMARDALAGYDPTKGASIGTYLTNSLKPMSRYVQKYQNTKYLPQYLVQEYGRFESAEAKLRDELGRPPEDIEIAKRMNLPERQIRRIRLAKSPEIAVSASENMEFDEAADDMERTRNADKLYYLRTTLSGKDRQIFDYLTGMGSVKPISDRAEIARKLGIPVAEVYAKTRRWARQVK